MLMRHVASAAAATSLALGILSLSSTASIALTCATGAIEARGEPSRYQWLAKTKARANWRARVRKTPGLGAPYANWARASNTDERCLIGPGGTLCIFSGTPCVP